MTFDPFRLAYALLASIVAAGAMLFYAEAGVLRSAPRCENASLSDDPLVTTRQFVTTANVNTFIADTSQGREIGIHGATWNVTQVEALFGRYRAELDAAQALEPNPAIGFLRRSGATVDRGAGWIEGHPQTIRVVAVIGLVILATFLPAILHELADFVRALRAG